VQRALRRGAAVLGGLAVLAGVASVGLAASAAAEPEAAPALPVQAEIPAQTDLHLVAFGGGNAIFDGLIEDITATAGPAMRVDVTHASSLTSVRAFCQDPNGRDPDILLTTQRIPGHVAADCAGTDDQPIAEVELGRGALVLAVRTGSALSQLTSHQVYLALTRDVPYRGEFRRNTAVRWSDIDRSLPAEDIRFQLPLRDDDARAMFDSLVLQAGCREEPQVKAIFSAQHRTARCVTTRVDRVREIRRDQAVRELQEAPEGTVGVLSFSDLVQAGGALAAVALDGVAPTAETVVEDSYSAAGSYWLYVRRGQQGADPAVDEALTRIIARADSEAVIGSDGLLTGLGLVPLPARDREAQRVALGDEASSYGIGATVGWAVSAVGRAWDLTGLSYGEINPPASADSIDLTKLMDIAGYKVKEIETTFGIIPGADMTFGLVREMSPADVDYLERTLYRDSRRRLSLLSAIQRRIVRTIIDVSSTQGYEVSKVDISLFPLPAVKLVVTPAEVVVGAETTLIMRAIERLQDRMNELGR